MGEIEGADPVRSAGAEMLTRLAAREQRAHGHASLGTHHWLLVLARRCAGMLEELVEGVNCSGLRSQLARQLTEGAIGEPLDIETATRRAREQARASGHPHVTERDLACVVLRASGYTPRDPSSPAVPAAPLKSTPMPATRPTPMLDRFSRDLTEEARRGLLPPLVGREEELALVIETLCRCTKRNPVLVGPAGVGKTAIAEGLAHRIAAGEVPALLRGARLLALQTASVVAGTDHVGELEKRMKAVLAEAAQGNVLLFIDELHAIVGAGASQADRTDVATLLKPALARGEIACIGATTTHEYRHRIEPDRALERRFQPIPVPELSPVDTLQVLHVHAGRLAALRGVCVPAEVLEWIVAFAGTSLRNRHFPDKAVDLLEQCVARAVARGLTEVDLPLGRQVGARLRGQPLDLLARLDRLAEPLRAGGLLSTAETNVLLDRLGVALRRLDVSGDRPKATLLLLGERAHLAAPLAETLAEALFDDSRRVVRVDFADFREAADLYTLLGAPPGHVGHGDPAPVHRLAEMPCCVLCCENVHDAHPRARSVLARALASGTLADSGGRAVALADTLVLLTARPAGDRPGALGFNRAPDGVPSRRMVEEALGPELLAQCDLVCGPSAEGGQAARRWLAASLLPRVTERYRVHGLDLRWEPSVVEWLLRQRGAREHPGRLIDRHISPLLVRLLPRNEGDRVSVVIRSEGEGVRARRLPHRRKR